MNSNRDYRIVAQYYDEAFGEDLKSDDIQFYLQAAIESQGPVLEIACGTGRILVPIANAGIEINGIDISRDMLDVLKRKLECRKQFEKPPNLVHGDMRSFRLNKKHSLVIIPFRSLQHMISLQDKLTALNMARDHLNDGGRLIFDVAFPRFEVIHEGLGKEYLVSEWTSKLAGQNVSMHFARHDYNKISQVVSAALNFRVQKNGRVNTYSQPLKMHFFSFPEIECLLSQVGFAIEACYGDFDRSALTDISDNIIIVAKHSNRNCELPNG